MTMRCPRPTARQTSAPCSPRTFLKLLEFPARQRWDETFKGGEILHREGEWSPEFGPGHERLTSRAYRAWLLGAPLPARPVVFHVLPPSCDTFR